MMLGIIIPHAGDSGLALLPKEPVGSSDRAGESSWGESGLPLTLWVCPHPREEDREKEEEVRGLHGARDKTEAAAAVTVGGGSTRRVLRFNPAQQSCRWLSTYGTGADVLGRAPEVLSLGLETYVREESRNEVLSMKCHDRLGLGEESGGEGREREAQEMALGENGCSGNLVPLTPPPH